MNRYEQILTDVKKYYVRQYLVLQKIADDKAKKMEGYDPVINKEVISSIESMAKTMSEIVMNLYSDIEKPNTMFYDKLDNIDATTREMVMEIFESTIADAKYRTIELHGETLFDIKKELTTYGYSISENICCETYIISLKPQNGIGTIDFCNEKYETEKEIVKKIKRHFCYTKFI